MTTTTSTTHPDPPLTVDERLQWMRERDERIKANAPVVPACPDWCRDDAGHEYDTLTDDEACYVRAHTSHPRGDVTITQEERNREGVLTLGEVMVTIYSGDGVDVTASQARERAEQLDTILGRR